jgi:hypothetical protein
MSKSLSIGEAIVATAKQKLDAAKARSSPADAEKPRDVILRSCERIADQLKGDGFSFVKSSPKLRRVHGDHVFSILFQSDRNNIAGRRAAVWIHAGVQNKGRAEFVDGGQIGDLLPQKTWMEWDFAGESARESEINDAVVAIRRIILPFFAQFENRTG